MDGIPGGGSSRLTFSGLASGLDTSSIIQALMDVEREPLRRLQIRRDDVDQQRSLVRDLNSKLLSLRDAARGLDNRTLLGQGESEDEELLSYQTTSSDEDVVTATATSGATASSIQVAVQQLATTGRQLTTALGEDDIVLAAGETATFTMADADATSFSVTAPSGGLTLSGLRERINQSSDNEDLLRAEVIRDGTDQFRLVVSSVATGEENDFTVSGDLAASLDAGLAQTAQNAIVQLFGSDTSTGVVVENASNDIENAVSGITLHLHRQSELEDGVSDPAGPRRNETLDVQVDVEGVKEKLQGFVKTYNEAVSFINEQFEVDEASEQAGPLSGDAGLRSLQLQLLGAVSRPYRFQGSAGNRFAPEPTGGSIGNVGLELKSDGTLSIDGEKLDEALSLDPGAFREFFSGAEDGSGGFDEGFATALVSRLEPVVRFGDGLLATRDDSFERRLDVIDDSIDRFERRLEQREETLRARFTAMEQIVASVEAQSGFLNAL